MLRPQVALLLVCIYLLTSTLHGQCLQAPLPDDCNGTEPLLADNEILGTGAKKWYYGATATYNQITLRGGALVVCGDLTFTNFYIDSGTIVIRPGARLHIGGGAGIVLRGNTAIYNYGTFEVTANLSLDNTWASANKPNILINATPAAVFNMSFTYFVINNPYSYFVNNGHAGFHGIITDPAAAAGSVCLGNGSETTMQVLYNKSKNTYTAPTGTACLKVNQYSQFYDTLTASPNINVCLGPTHYSDSSCRPFGCKPNAWGAANRFQFCNSCTDAQVLTVRNSLNNRSSISSTEVSLSPNPFFSNIQLAWPRGKKPESVVITNAAGFIIYSQRVNTFNNYCIIQLPGSLPLGEYIAKMFYPHQVIVKKIIKAR